MFVTDWRLEGSAERGLTRVNLLKGWRLGHRGRPQPGGAGVEALRGMCGPALAYLYRPLSRAARES